MAQVQARQQINSQKGLCRRYADPMWQYNLPLRDMRFVIETVINAPASWRKTSQFAQLDTDAVTAILSAAGQFASEVLEQTNALGDQHGCKLENNAVITPAGFRAAYQAFIEAGWPTLACETAEGGQGLPLLLQAATFEMLSACNHAWAMYPGVSHGAYECLKAHASPTLRERYLSKIVSGEYLAAMAITEPHAGSDVSLIRTQAVTMINGSVAVTGSKIFISGGDHDLTDNILHLVLCRLPNAPNGNKGLSLVLVPKLLPDGARNSFRCVGVEKKMGIHGNATCTMQYDAATGWVVGEPHRGLSAMFVMMNSARLHVGLQGLGHLEMATQNAIRYAQERLQMRAPIRPPSSTDSAADPIAAHPAIRKKLATATAYVDGARILCYWVGMIIDEAAHHLDECKRKQADQLAALLTPIVKAFVTDIAHRNANELLQVWGGFGYLRDFGIEQIVRDSRIAMIYEGSNEIQAIDLLIRKVLDDQGVRFELLLATLEISVQVTPRKSDDLGPQLLLQQLSELRMAVAALLAGRAQDPEWPYRVADHFMQAAGYLLMSWAWTKSIMAAQSTDPAPSDTRSDYLAQKIAVARFGLEWLAPTFSYHLGCLTNSKASLPSFLPNTLT